VDARAPGILWLHGLGSSADDWNAQLAAFAGDYRLLLVDLPGHGRSSIPRGRPTVEAMADRVAALLDDIAEPPAHVVGLSLGGCVGLALALRHPARVRSLTLVNAFAVLRPADTGAALRMLLRGALLALAPMSAVGRFVAATAFPHPEQAALRLAAAASLARTPRRAYVASVRALARFDARPSLARLRCPTMVVAGADDRTIALAAKDALAHGIAGARWVVVPGSGHVTSVDRADEFNAVLREFIAAH
jgi:pimeloyl-ACP methyl ester carboxylesterase